VVLYDLQRRTNTTVKLPPDSHGLHVYPRGRDPELISVGNQLIEPRDARVVATIPGLFPICATMYSPERQLLYYSTLLPRPTAVTRVTCFDVRQLKVVGQVDLPKVGHGRARTRPALMDQVYALQLGRDGSVLVIAGGNPVMLRR